MLHFQIVSPSAYLPRDWEVALAIVSRYFHWSRADAWDCDVQELLWWADQMKKIEGIDES